MFYNFQNHYHSLFSITNFKKQGYLISLFNNKLVIILRIVCYYSLYGYPVEFPNDCEVVMFGCEKRAVKKNDHTIECKVTAMIG